MDNSKKLRVGILGATGMVGQRFVSLLDGHPWFEVAAVAASPRSAGRTYAEATKGRWKMTTPLPQKVAEMTVLDVAEMAKVTREVDFVFCAVEMAKDEIYRIEEAYARADLPVVSSNSAHRWTPDVPMLMPEINAAHLDAIEQQRRRLGTRRGFIVVKPNCSIQSYLPVLAAWQAWEPQKVIASTYQAISGAGKNFDDWPEMMGNLIPYIGGEEEKSEQEPLRILGSVTAEGIVPATAPLISCQCLRVPLLDGHTAAVHVDFRKKPSTDELIEAVRSFEGLPQKLNLPSAPQPFMRYHEDDDRPQVRLDVDYGKGMGISVGRIRPDHIYDFKFVALSHNTVRGAAGGGVLSAELLRAQGYL